MSSEYAKKYVAENIIRSPRDAGWYLPMPVLKAYPNGGVPFMAGDKNLTRGSTVVLYLAELQFEFENEVARREAAAAKKAKTS